ncbi:radical SAM/SPASM domain-containing protein [Croceicoccus marinus]|jgi:pyruvate-formate lyase-activating enzyme|uniref:Radical SAM protein n=1 Tax=Croceicoccus marinus TaxID=450378 RepID=A0A7G6VSL9_9SPHN|nr:radical SAM protein [Croceicoccus marinus]QNE04734.1 radical SAM protein [Croceicoccus marinus]
MTFAANVQADFGKMDPVTRMTLTELAGFQSIADHHITFSLTLACPLSCSHCIVNASPLLKHTTMLIESARDYASQMPGLAAAGIRSMSFTGGEPFLARPQLKVMSEAAAAVGIHCGVVTAGHWANKREAADRLVREFAAIESWDVSIDSYHLDWVEMETVVNAICAARDAGRTVSVRFTYTDPPTDRDLAIHKAITKIEGVKIASQRVRAEGRAEKLKLEKSDKYSPYLKPCLTQGMVVRYDGSVAPCCLNLVESRDHPFQFGDARTRPLTEVHRDYRVQPLLKLIRTMGFAELVDWLEADGLIDPTDLPDDACDLCSAVMQRPDVTKRLIEIVSEPAMELRIAMLASRVLGEHEMLHDVQARNAGRFPPHEAKLVDEYLKAIDPDGEVGAYA